MTDRIETLRAELAEETGEAKTVEIEILRELLEAYDAKERAEKESLHYIEGAGRYFARAEFLLQHGDAFVDHLHDIGETEAAHQLLAMLKEKGDG